MIRALFTVSPGSHMIHLHFLLNFAMDYHYIFVSLLISRPEGSLGDPLNTAFYLIHKRLKEEVW